MLVLLPLLALGACIVALSARAACWRAAALGGAVVWGAALVGITEGLSLFHWLTASGLAAAWLVVLLAAVVVAGRTRTLAWPRAPEWPDAALLGPLAACVALLGAIAVMSPPNTWDSMTYHLARVVHWAQDASLAPYPTHILRQLSLQPGAEYVLLHLQLLSGGDHLAGLVQWASMVGVLLATPLIAGELGARRAGARCASLFAASLPIGILESTSTQNDYVVAFWLVCATLFGLHMARPRGARVSWTTSAAFGTSAGLAMLTKATAYLFVLPLGLWLAVCLGRRYGWRGLASLALAGAIALALNAGFYSRNLAVFGSPVGPLDEGAPSVRYVNDTLTPALLVSNVVRDVGINLNATPLAAINVRTVNFVRLVHTWLGVDIADPRTTWGEQVFSEQPVGLAFDENFASNPLHLVLLVGALVGVWPLRRTLSWTAVVYAGLLVGGFVLFSAVLRWQPWNTRLELPFFVLGAPLVGTLAERIAPRLAVVLAAGLLISMLPWLVYNQARPLVGQHSMLISSREAQYFTNRPSIRAAYLGAIDYVHGRGCARLGFVSDVDGWEYPWWPLLQGNVSDQVEIEHVGVANVSAALASPSTSGFEPCAIVALGPLASLASIDVHGRSYQASWAVLDPTAVPEQVAVLTPDAALACGFAGYTCLRW